MSETTTGQPPESPAWNMSVLPHMLGDGEEAPRRAALTYSAHVYLDEQDAALNRDAAAEVVQDTTKPDSSGYVRVEDYLQARNEWRATHPTHVDTLTASWRQALGLENTNRLHKLFAAVDSLESTEVDDEVGHMFSRPGLADLRTADPDFFAACIRASRSVAMDREMHQPEHPTREQRATQVINEWIADTYMTEAVSRMRSIGVSEDAIRKLIER